MKKIIQTFGVFILIALFTSGCKKENVTPNPTTTANVNSTALVGNWKVGSFIKDTVDLTNQFNGYIFYCYSNGNLTIQGNAHNYNNCNWRWDDDNYTMCNLHLMGCENNSVLWLVNQDWDLSNHDSLHCYFSSHNPTDRCTMTWIKI